MINKTFNQNVTIKETKRLKTADIRYFFGVCMFFLPHFNQFFDWRQAARPFVMMNPHCFLKLSLSRPVLLLFVGLTENGTHDKPQAYCVKVFFKEIELLVELF